MDITNATQAMFGERKKVKKMKKYFFSAYYGIIPMDELLYKSEKKN